MSKTNCINCGAAKEWDAVKCPFCGTSYFDFTSIDFTKQEPVACQFAVPVTHNGKTYKGVMTMLAKPSLRSMDFEDEFACITGHYGEPLFHFTKSRSMNSRVEFQHIVAPDGSLCKLEVKEAQPNGNN